MSFFSKNFHLLLTYHLIVIYLGFEGVDGACDEPVTGPTHTLHNMDARKTPQQPFESSNIRIMNHRSWEIRKEGGEIDCRGWTNLSVAKSHDSGDSIVSMVSCGGGQDASGGHGPSTCHFNLHDRPGRLGYLMYARPKIWFWA